MNEEELVKLADILEEYLTENKVFVQNPERMSKVNAATEMACRLFPEAEINIEDDPLQMGAIILTIKDFDIVVRETEMFVEIINDADNFEIFKDNEGIKISILFSNALILL